MKIIRNAKSSAKLAIVVISAQYFFYGVGLGDNIEEYYVLLPECDGERII